MKVKHASRTDGVRYAIRDVVVLAKQLERTGREMLYLNIGDPVQAGFSTPAHIVDAICQAVRAGMTSYCPSEGVPEALEAVRKDAEQKGIPNIRSVFLTTGVSEGIEIALTALLEPGDDVLLPSPGYPLYPAVLAKLAARRNNYDLVEEDGWQPDVEDIERKVTPRTKALVIINPNNPTGAVCSKQAIDRVVAVAKRHGLVILADEVYDKLLLDEDVHIPVASRAGDHPVLTFGGLSKNYLGPGLRIGWTIVGGDAAALEAYVDAMGRLVRARLCASHPVQHAVRAALEGPEDHIVELIEALRRRRDLIYRRLNAIEGVSCAKPLGAFYAFPRLHDWPGSDAEFTVELMKETGVVTVPGGAFGQPSGTQHFRIVFLPSPEVLERALDLIEGFLRRRSG